MSLGTLRRPGSVKGGNSLSRPSTISGLSVRNGRARSGRSLGWPETIRTLLSTLWRLAHANLRQPLLPWWWLCAATGLLSACAAVPPPAVPDSVSPPARFVLEGRLTVSDGAQAFAGRFRWQRTDNTEEIALIAPNGSIVGILRFEAEGARLLLADGTEQTAATPEALFGKLIDMPLPPLTEWRRALWTPASGCHDGWCWRTQPHTGTPWPQRVMAEREPWRLTLVIDERSELP